MNQNKKNLYQEYENAMILKDIFVWFNEKLDINYAEQPISDYSYMAKTKDVEKICKLISAFGTGITNFKLVNISPERVFEQLSNDDRNRVLKQLQQKQVEMRNNNQLRGFGMIMRSQYDFFILDVDKEENVSCRTIQFNHGRANILYSLEEESDGTVRILDLLEILLTGEGKTYVVDELDRCLHPSLTYKFVEIFLDYVKEKNIQLIATTHESRLMDFDLLRRDEIWFVNKRTSGETDIYSLEEYNERFDKKIDKAYLEGRYGGIPVFSTIFPI